MLVSAWPPSNSSLPTSKAAMRIAAIDLGSNSIHMIVVEVDASGGFRVIEKEREMVRLGALTLSRRQLSAAAMKRGLEVMAKYKRLASTHRVDKIIAVATAAVREAGNGEEFLRRVGRTTSIWPRAVSGETEARLIYLSVLHSIHLEGRRALVVDIGGGSVELALGAGTGPEWAVSEKLGVIRMAERYATADPLGRKNEERLEAFVKKKLAPHGARVREAEIGTAIGTSGTILTLGRMAHQIETGVLPDATHHLSVRRPALREVRKRLVDADLRERLRMPGMDAPRADILPVGAVILDTILGLLGIEELVLCDWALREGILLDYIHRHPKTLARAEAYPDVRKRSVVALAERCQYDEAHARQTAALALSLFDQARSWHGLGDGERAILEYAALLHDIGHHISYAGHHKHTYYLVKNGDLRGFTPPEIEVLANVARYHRRGLPCKKHAAYACLSTRGRRAVRVLAGCLRIADALDRSHRQVVRDVRVVERNGALRVKVSARGDCELELWGVAGRVRLLERELGVTLRVDVAPTSVPAAALIRPAR
jgi:exopolyphosphatase/guanosine-5'-triphosphate,3'-diphosphate pyrophosphatase